MLFAIHQNEKKEPIPNTQAKCPFCGEKVISKCGEIKVWHWAHANSRSCDSWYEPETYWHKNWKLTFGKENSEIKITRNDNWHIADVLTKKNVVIELQNSTIQKSTIRKREEFYGEKMIWLINGKKFKDNFYIKDWDNELNWFSLNHNNCKDIIGKKMFRWDYPRKSWENTRKHVFIDFHNEALVWIHKGMGSKWGECKLVSKSEFISKYGGDFNLHLLLFRNLTIAVPRKTLKLKGIKENKIHLITSIKHKGKIRMLEIYFRDVNDISKLKIFQNIIINGTLNYEKENKNLQLVNSKIVN